MGRLRRGQQVLFVGLLLVSAALVTFGMQRAFYGLSRENGIDWQATYAELPNHLLNPYTIETFTNPPWVMALIPHMWLPASWGAALNFVVTCALILAVVRRYGGNWQTLVLTFASAPFLDLVRTMNVDWITMLALLVPPMWGLPLLSRTRSAWWR